MVIGPVEEEIVRGQWNYIDLTEHGFVTGRDFYVVYIQVGDYPNCPGLGFDLSSSAGRSYDYFAGGTFSLLPAGSGNAMIRAYVTGGSGIGLYDPDNGRFLLRWELSAGNPDYSYLFLPLLKDISVPITGDWNGDSSTTAGLYNRDNGRFYLRNAHSQGAADYVFQFRPALKDIALPLTGAW